MYNTYMSEDDLNKLKPGDEIVVRNLDDLKHDFGKDIMVPPCGWNDLMNDLCGMALTANDIDEYGVISVKDYEWHFIREMLEPCSQSSSSAEELSQMWEKMILGNGDDNEE